MNWIFTIATLFLMTAFATAEPSRPLTLREAVSTSLKDNNFIRAVGHQADAARQGIGIADSRYYPSILFEETFSVTNAPTQAFMMKLDEGRFSQNDFQPNNLNHPAAYHDFRTALTLHQPLYNPSLAPARQIAIREAEKRSSVFESSKQDIAFMVFRLYLDVQKASATMQAVEAAKKDAEENMRLAMVRTSTGVGLRSDELRARTHLASIDQQLITARNNLILVKMQMANIIGLKEVHVEVVDQLPSFMVGDDREELVRTALSNRSDLRQGEAELEKTNAAVKLATSAYLPALGAFATYQMNAKDTPFGADNDALMAGLSLKWQIFDGFRRCRERDKALAERSAADEMLQNSTREIRFQVQESYLRHTEMAKRLEVARHALQDAQETVRLLTKRYENSLATMLELLDAQQTLNQARAGLVESEASYALSGGRVYYAMGTFLQEILK